MADDAPSRSLRERLAHLAADRVAERHRRDPERLVAYLKGRNTMAFSEAVREALQETGLSLYEISKRSGVSQSVLSRFMREERDITLGTLDRLEAVLRLSIGPRRSKRRG